jgi:hypothetical protein
VLLNPVTLWRRHLDYGAIEGLFYGDGGSIFMTSALELSYSRCPSLPTVRPVENKTHPAQNGDVDRPFGRMPNEDNSEHRNHN